MDPDVPKPDDTKRAPGRRPAQFIELSEAECRALLANQTIGRVGWQPQGNPLILPVTYLFVDRLIIFRTSAYGVLAELVTRTKVAFEVDVLDHERRTGGSVLVQGTSGPAPVENRARQWRLDDVLPWASGTRHLFVAITIKKLTGRSVTRPNVDASFLRQQQRS
ncbi:MAG TPA: pyridoxamine 5'-phosphate oxidase family protein [Microlunatus sp.]